MANKIGHFLVEFCLCVKTSLRAKPFIENMFSIQVRFHADHTYFHMKGFCTMARFQRHKVTRSWPIMLLHRYDVLRGVTHLYERKKKRFWWETKRNGIFSAGKFSDKIEILGVKYPQRYSSFLDFTSLLRSRY